MEKQALVDRARGRLPSEAELAKNLALWRGAGFKGPCPSAPAEDRRTGRTRVASRKQEGLRDNLAEDEQVEAGGVEDSGEVLDDISLLDDHLGEAELEGDTPGDLVDLPLHHDLGHDPQADAARVPDRLEGAEDYHEDYILVDADQSSRASSEERPVSPGPRAGLQAVALDYEDVFNNYEDSEGDDGAIAEDDDWLREHAVARASSEERPLSPGATPQPGSSPPGSPRSQLDPQDVLNPLNDGLAMDLDDHAFSEPSSDEDDFYAPDHAQDADVLLDNPAGDDEDAGAIVLDENDPLYAHAEDLFDDDICSALLQGDQLPPAFREDSLVRRAYVQAFISATFHGTTKDGVAHFLTSMRSNYASIAARFPAAQVRDLENMAVTLRTVERRLGVDPDQRIIYYFVCNKCWHRHHPSELYKLEFSACLQPGCTGSLYDIKTLSDGRKRRRPTKILPTTSLKQEIQRILLRPGKPEELNAWRQEQDAPGRKPPVSQADWPGNHDSDYRMYDMHDGWGWNAVMAGLQRRRGGRWEVEDVDVHGIQQRFVALPMGLILIFNIDWFVVMQSNLHMSDRVSRFRGTKRGRYSVGAIYATICNNPRAKRFLMEETILLAIIPGPDEPSLEQLNAVLEPFATEARAMYSGQ